MMQQTRLGRPPKRRVLTQEEMGKLRRMVTRKFGKKNSDAFMGRLKLFLDDLLVDRYARGYAAGYQRKIRKAPEDE